MKIFIDLMKHATNLGASRDDLLAKEIPVLLRKFYNREPSSSDIANVTRRLGLASYEPMGITGIRLHRTDYIGHEVDRFFRATKTALPGIVTVGETVLKEMQLILAPVGDGIYAVQDGSGRSLIAGHPPDPVHCCISPPERWKGISYNYATYGLFAPRSLKGLYVYMDADRRNGIPVAPYDCTAERISRNVVDKLAADIVGRATQTK